MVASTIILVFAVVYALPECTALASHGSVSVRIKRSTRNIHFQDFYPFQRMKSIQCCRFPRDITMQMGIRSYIRKHILGRDRNDDNGSDNDDSLTTVNLRSMAQIPASAGLLESPLTYSSSDQDNQDVMDEFSNPVSLKKISSQENIQKVNNRLKVKSINDIFHHDMNHSIREEAKDRIRRVQGGDMTEEEKMMFLNTALMRTAPPKKPKGPPIRQKIPGVEEEVSSGKGKTDRLQSSIKNDSASSSDNLWNAITRRDIAKSKQKGEKSHYIPLTSIMLDGKLKDEEAKRQWIDSITSPDRFSSFTSIQKTSVSSDDDSVRADGFDLDEDNTDGKHEDLVPIDEFQLINEKEVGADREQNLNSSNAKQGPTSIALENIGLSSNTDDLASRLEKAALAQENRDAKARADAQKKSLEEKQALLQLQKEREAIFIRQETERMEKARRQEEQLRLQEDAKKQAEREKLEAALAKQDEYWTNKLKKEEAKRMSNLSAQEKNLLVQQNMIKAAKSKEMLDHDIAKEVERERIREDVRTREPVVEGKVLEKAEEEMIRNRELVHSIIDESAAKVSHKELKSTKESASISSFVQQQRSKKEELDKLVKFQQEQLKKLNSPLPSPKTQPFSTPSFPISSVVTTTFSPLTSYESFSDLAPSTRSRKINTSIAENSSTAQRLPNYEKNNTKAPPPGPYTTENISLGAAGRPIKRSVRQQLPISRKVESDEDEDDLMRSRASGLTVADALKEQRKVNGNKESSSDGSIRKTNLNGNDRAKQWGIDMSKFK